MSKTTKKLLHQLLLIAYKMRELGQSLYRQIAKINNDVNNYTISPVGYFGDWQEISEPFTYTTANTMTVENTNVDLNNIFSIGDPIRLKQGAGFKYFYITNVTTNVITINGGSDYTLTNSAITDIARGLKPNATGFPFTFNFTANFQTPGINQLSGLTNENYKFWLQGRTVSVNLEFEGADLAGANSSIVCDLPIAPNVSSGGIPAFAYLATNNFIPQTGIVKLGTSALFDAEFQILNDSGFALWVISTNGVGIDASFTYLI